jgi:protein-tyrosine phosphatase
MIKLVFDYTYCSEPECWEWNIPFEYKSKERFILDVLDNPLILNDMGIIVYEYQIEEKTIWKEDYIENIEHYVFTLDEWFEKNKTVIITNSRNQRC